MEQLKKLNSVYKGDYVKMMMKEDSDIREHLKIVYILVE